MRTETGDRPELAEQNPRPLYGYLLAPDNYNQLLATLREMPWKFADPALNILGSARPVQLTAEQPQPQPQVQGAPGGGS